MRVTTMKVLSALLALCFASPMEASDVVWSSTIGGTGHSAQNRQSGDFDALETAINDNDTRLDSLGTGAFLIADTGGDAAEDTLSLDNYDVFTSSFAETFDASAEFTVSADEVCYTGSTTIQVEINMSISFDRSTGSGTDLVTLAFGKDTTGAIDDGDEFGEEYQRTFSGTDVGMGHISATTTLATNDCISLLAKTNDIAGGAGFTMEAGSLTIQSI